MVMPDTPTSICEKLVKLNRLEVYNESLIYAKRCRSLYEVQQLLKIRIEDLEKEIATHG